jgi:hypothetical protein
LVAWLKERGITTLAMEATSVYWIPLEELLKAAGRKTDVMDCQWLRYLQAVGLLRAAFRPPVSTRAG